MSQASRYSRRIPAELFIEIVAQLLPWQHPLSYGLPRETKQSLLQLCLTDKAFKALATPHLYANIRLSYSQVPALIRTLEAMAAPLPIVESLAITWTHKYEESQLAFNDVNLRNNLERLFYLLGRPGATTPLTRLYLHQDCVKFGQEYQNFTLLEIIRMLPDLTDVGAVRMDFWLIPEINTHPSKLQRIVTQTYPEIGKTELERFFGLPNIKSILTLQGHIFDDVWEAIRCIHPPSIQSHAFLYGMDVEGMPYWDSNYTAISGEGYEANVYPVPISNRGRDGIIQEKILDGSIWDTDNLVPGHLPLGVSVVQPIDWHLLHLD